MEFLGKNIQFFRKRDFKSQKAFGKFMHKGQTTIANWEKGSNFPSVKEVYFMSRHFGVSLDELFGVDLAEKTLQAVMGDRAAPAARTFPGAKPYDMEPLPSSLARETDPSMEYLLKKIQTMEKDIEELKTRPEEADHRSGNTGTSL